MKKREISNTDLEYLFNTIIEQPPLMSEGKLNTLLSKLPNTSPPNVVKRFFKIYLNNLLLATTAVLIILGLSIWINSIDQTKDTIVKLNQNNNNTIAIPTDTIQAKQDDMIEEKIASKSSITDSIIKELKRVPPAKHSETPSLRSTYIQLNKKQQKFNIEWNRDTIITCEEGTQLLIKANTFISDKSRKDIQKDIQISVKEYYKLSDIILANLSTTSNNKILETGGMLHISASAGNEKCIIKADNKIGIGFPYSTEKNNMKLFYGKRIDENIDWKLQKTESATVVDVTPAIRLEQESQTFFIVEEMPEFSGGQTALNNYIIQNAQYPYSTLEDKIEGTVYIRFIVDKDGNTRNFFVLRGINKTLDKVAMYLVSEMPKWKPGKQRGRSVNVSYTIPISFSNKKLELTEEEINQSKILEEKLKEFEARQEARLDDSINNFYKDFEEKAKDDKIQELTSSDVNRYIFSVTQLGWINCDRFIRVNDSRTDLFILTDQPDNTKVTMIFHKFRSILTGSFDIDAISFNNIPLGEEVTLVAFKSTNTGLQIAVKDTKISNKQELVLDFHPITIDRLKEEVKKIDKLRFE